MSQYPGVLPGAVGREMNGPHGTNSRVLGKTEENSPVSAVRTNTGRYRMEICDASENIPGWERMTDARNNEDRRISADNYLSSI